MLAAPRTSGGAGAAPAGPVRPLDIAELRDKLSHTLKQKERKVQEQGQELQALAAELER